MAEPHVKCPECGNTQRFEVLCQAWQELTWNKTEEEYEYSAIIVGTIEDHSATEYYCKECEHTFKEWENAYERS